VETATGCIAHCHFVQSSADLSGDGSNIPVLISAMPRIDGLSAFKNARHCSITAVELALHLDVTPGWLFGRKKIKGRPGLASEKQFSGATLLWENGVLCRPVSEQEHVENLVHIPIPLLVSGGHP
jgi:hypothetical protein